MTFVTLDRLETTGILVEPFDPSTAQNAVAKRPAQARESREQACRRFLITIR